MAKILVAEDEAVVLGMVKAMLGRRGHTVITAEDGQAALILAGVEMPDIIILDTNMPKLDGHETLKRLRADEKTAAIPVLMMTGLRSEANVKLSISLGAQGYLAKPFSSADLTSRIDRLLAAKAPAKDAS